MPKFSDAEKSAIHFRLKKEGRRLFSQYGIKKVTVDDIVNSTNIAKGSFYIFYENKEQLFMELNLEEQEKIFAEIEREIEKSHITQPKLLTNFLINIVLERFIQNPILMQINNEIFDYLQRKIPPEMIEQHLTIDSYALKKLQLYGVEFKFPITVVSKSLHPIFAYAVNIKSDCDYKSIMKILIEGVLSQVLK